MDFYIERAMLVKMFESQLMAFRPEIIKLARIHIKDRTYVVRLTARLKELKRKFELQSEEAEQSYLRLKKEKAKEDNEIFLFLFAIFFGHIKVIPDFDLTDLEEKKKKRWFNGKR